MATTPAPPDKPDRPYVLKGKKIGFKSVHKEDAITATPWFQNLDMITCLSARGRPETVESENAFYERVCKNEEGEIHFSIFELASDKHIGGCGLFNIRPANHATLGICIGEPAAWNKGYGGEAVRLLAEYGLFFLNLYNIRLGVFGFNERARRAYLRAGFKECGRFRGVIMVGGKRYDDVWMEITRDDVDLSGMQYLVPLLKDAVPRASC
jgi:RimJ/RimL family protein N-acetyltransferase